jgi:hypothetical protein
MISTSHSDLACHPSPSLPAARSSHSAPPSLFSPKPHATAAVNHPAPPLSPLPLPFHPPHSHTARESSSAPQTRREQAAGAVRRSWWCFSWSKGGRRRATVAGRHMAGRGAVRSCVQTALKAANSLVGLAGMAVILYALWMLRAWSTQAAELHRHLPVPWYRTPPSTDLSCSPVVSREKRRNFLAPPSVLSRALDSRFTEFPPFASLDFCC